MQTIANDHGEWSYVIGPYREPVATVKQGETFIVETADVCPGNIVYLPVNVSGALLYVGDGHAAQGDAEVCGVATEIPTRGLSQ